MQIVDSNLTVDNTNTNGGAFQCNFGMVMTPQAFKTATEGLYSDLVSSMVRELISNADDAQVVNGNKNTIKVYIPKWKLEYETDDKKEFVSFEERDKNSLYFSVRDYGCSMTEDFIKEIYVNFFKSSKTDDSTQTGGFGLGCKIPIAYADEYEMTTFIDGHFKQYRIDKETGLPRISLVKEGDTKVANGTFIKVPIKLGSLRRFRNALSFLKKYSSFKFDVMNMDVKPYEVLHQGSCYTNYKNSEYDSSYGMIVRIGKVPYRLVYGDFSNHFGRSKYNRFSVFDSLEEGCTLGDLVDKIPSLKALKDMPDEFRIKSYYNTVGFDDVWNQNIIIDFGLNELFPIANRETIKFDDTNCNAIVDKLAVVVKEEIDRTIDFVKTNFVGKIFTDNKTYKELDREYKDMFMNRFLQNVKTKIQTKDLTSGLINFNEIEVDDCCHSFKLINWNFQEWFKTLVSEDTSCVFKTIVTPDRSCTKNWKATPFVFQYYSTNFIEKHIFIVSNLTANELDFKFNDIVSKRNEVHLLSIRKYKTDELKQLAEKLQAGFNEILNNYFTVEVVDKASLKTEEKEKVEATKTTKVVNVGIRQKEADEWFASVQDFIDCYGEVFIDTYPDTWGESSGTDWFRSNISVLSAEAGFDITPMLKFKNLHGGTKTKILAKLEENGTEVYDLQSLDRETLVDAFETSAFLSKLRTRIVRADVCHAYYKDMAAFKQILPDKYKKVFEQEYNNFCCPVYLCKIPLRQNVNEVIKKYLNIFCQETPDKELYDMVYDDEKRKTISYELRDAIQDYLSKKFDFKNLRQQMFDLVEEMIAKQDREFLKKVQMAQRLDGYPYELQIDLANVIKTFLEKPMGRAVLDSI